MSLIIRAFPQILHCIQTWKLIKPSLMALPMGLGVSMGTQKVVNLENVICSMSPLFMAKMRALLCIKELNKTFKIMHQEYLHSKPTWLPQKEEEESRNSSGNGRSRVLLCCPLQWLILPSFAMKIGHLLELIHLWFWSLICWFKCYT